jgi:hypothetical protein
VSACVPLFSVVCVSICTLCGVCYQCLGQKREALLKKRGKESEIETLVKTFDNMKDNFVNYTRTLTDKVSLKDGKVTAVVFEQALRQHLIEDFISVLSEEKSSVSSAFSSASRLLPSTLKRRFTRHVSLHEQDQLILQPIPASFSKAKRPNVEVRLVSLLLVCVLSLPQLQVCVCLCVCVCVCIFRQRDSYWDVADSLGKWLPAHILNRTGDRVFVHYEGWDSKWDEWIDFNKEPLRFAEFRTCSTGQPPMLSHCSYALSVLSCCVGCCGFDRVCAWWQMICKPASKLMIA